MLISYFPFILRAYSIATSSSARCLKRWQIPKVGQTRSYRTSVSYGDLIQGALNLFLGACMLLITKLYRACAFGFVFSMFLSRTVAAEVCMEAKTNEHAYAALKKLDQSGDLLFELSYVFIRFRVCHSHYIETLSYIEPSSKI